MQVAGEPHLSFVVFQQDALLFDRLLTGSFSTSHIHCPQGFKVILGPDLRVAYPFFLNFGVSGELELNGIADPLLIKPRGTILFENGDVNLVATQVKLNRDHQNKAVFLPEQVNGCRFFCIKFR